MADNPPGTPPVPPTPGEAAKVQPKKETVRIALPPKPTAAPTVRLPSPPPGGPPPGGATAAPSAAKPAPAASAPSAAVSKAPSPVAAGAPVGAAAPAPAPMTRPMMAPLSTGGGITGLDKGLAIAAAVLSFAFLVHIVLITLGVRVE